MKERKDRPGQANNVFRIWARENWNDSSRCCAAVRDHVPIERCQSEFRSALKIETCLVCSVALINCVMALVTDKRGRYYKKMPGLSLEKLLNVCVCVCTRTRCLSSTIFENARALRISRSTIRVVPRGKRDRQGLRTFEWYTTMLRYNICIYTYVYNIRTNIL